MYQLIYPFFGLTPDNSHQARLNLFTEIHEIVFHGQGGYDWETIYNMPIWLRKFTFSRIADHYTQQNEQAKAASKNSKATTLMDSSGNVNKEAAPIKGTGKVQYK